MAETCCWQRQCAKCPYHIWPGEEVRVPIPQGLWHPTQTPSDSPKPSMSWGGCCVPGGHLPGCSQSTDQLHHPLLQFLTLQGGSALLWEENDRSTSSSFSPVSAGTAPSEGTAISQSHKYYKAFENAKGIIQWKPSFWSVSLWHTPALRMAQIHVKQTWQMAKNTNKVPSCQI